MYTNLSNHGGNLKKIIDHEINKAEAFTIATGYMSISTLNEYRDNMIKIAQKGGQAKLLIGMAFYEGLSHKILDASLLLNKELSKMNSENGVFVAYGRRYHGKIYLFENKYEQYIYTGSSNFSPSGIGGNIECTLKITDDIQKRKIISFLKDLYSNSHARKIDQVEINTKNKRLISITAEQRWRKLNKHSLTINTSLPKVEISLARIVEKEKSNLNVYFGKGRLNNSTQKIAPRPWYEIEIICPNEINSLPNYPKGDFEVLTDDGYVIPMNTHGDNYKNLRSKGSLQLFGIWLKGKLEKANVLDKYQPVTMDTLAEYGNDKLILYKISDDKYYLSFIGGAGDL